MTATQDTTKDAAAKAAALSLLARGLATQAEVARLAGVSRQLMAHWSQDIPIERNRNAVLMNLWRKAVARNVPARR